MNKKNVILITVDSLRKDFLSLSDGAFPNLKKLAGESCVFNNVYATAPATRGAFSSIFTSTYPSMYGGKISISEERMTIAEAFKRSGWRTYGFHSNPFLSKLFKYDKGFKVFYDDLSITERMSGSKMHLVNRIKRIIKLQAYLPAEKLNKKVFGILDNNDLKEENNFIWVHYMDAHGPYYGRRRGISLARPFYEMRWQKAIRARSNSHLTAKLKKDYVNELKYLDVYIGELIDYFKKRGIYDQSIIVFMADHGDAFGEHGFYSHPQKLYNELIKIPLMMKFPKKFTTKIDLDKLISTIDLAPSLLNFCEVKVPEKFLGIDFVSDNFNEYVFSEADTRIDMNTGEQIEQMFSLVNDKWKYIFETESKTEELFDLISDPHEITDLSGDHPEVMLMMKRKLAEYRNLLASGEKETRLEQKEDIEQIEERLKTLGYM